MVSTLWMPNILLCDLGYRVAVSLPVVTGGGTAASGQSASVTGHAARRLQCLAQQEFNLCVRAPQVIGRPTRKRVVDGRIEPEQQLFATGD